MHHPNLESRTPSTDYLQKMRRRTLLLAALAILVALGCARLGMWQLDRHGHRQAYNAQVGGQRDASAIELASARADSVERYRRASAQGVFDFANELVLANRTRNGSPGVHLITPLVLGDGRVVLVNRGWVYSPDATRVDQVRWREADTVSVSGYVEEMNGAPAAQPAQLVPGVWQRLDPERLNDALPYRVGTTYLVATEVTPTEGETPARLGLPAMEQGPHLSYAFQWFAFGAIALIGGGILVAQDLRRRR